MPVASFTVSKWAWLRREEPASRRGSAPRPPAARPPHVLLTGEAATDRGDASGTGWWSSALEGYSTEVLGLAAVDLDPARCRP